MSKTLRAVPDPGCGMVPSIVTGGTSSNRAQGAYQKDVPASSDCSPRARTRDGLPGFFRGLCMSKAAPGD
ncbi:MAG TPA: hypothetical protein VM409_01395 [Chloroflexia bacterium]|nr:hypothetical protein [Chloroflexia bacterium]